MLQSQPAVPGLWAWADLVIITTDHSGFNYQEMADHAKLIFDTRNATAGCHGGHIVVLGQPDRPEAAALQSVPTMNEMPETEDEQTEHVQPNTAEVQGGAQEESAHLQEKSGIPMANHDRVSERYYGEINSEDSHEATRTRIHWMCREATGKRILDVGCSQGITSILLAREGFRVTGVDLEEESIRYAQAELAKESKPVRNNVDFRMLDITQWKVKTTFDTVLLGEVLEHFAHPETLLLQVHRLLQEEGR